MRPRRHRLLLLALLAALALSAAAPAAPTQDDDTPAGSFAGAWETTFGAMVLDESGTRVTGTYVMEGQRCTIEGRLEGAELVFRYREPAASGEGRFTLAKDGMSFTGRWRETGQEAWHPWTGKRVRARAPFDGVFDTSFGKMRLARKGNRVRGIYAFGAAVSTLEGEVDGKRLAFRYVEPQAQGEGWFDLSSTDGARFAGEWRAEGSSEWRGWKGERVEPIPGRVWLVVVEARWEGGLADREYSFGEMLRSFFARSSHVEVRHRFFTDEESLGKWCTETAYLPEPVVLVIATHGSPEGVVAGGRTVGGREIAAHLRMAANLRLLHFSACLVMKDRLARDILSHVGEDAAFPVSGYTTSVDWGASAVAEMLYLDLVLSRGQSPEQATESVRRLMPFAGDERLRDAPFESLGLQLVRSTR